MPQPRQHVSALRLHAGRLGRMFRRRDAVVVARAPVGIDPHTRAFWARGMDAPVTPVEVDPVSGADGGPSRIAAMIAAHESGRPHGPRPRGNPAFAEAVFIELMRASQYRRAFDQLSADCRRSWGSAEAFAAAQGRGAMSRVRGVRVKNVRFLDEWTDPDRGSTHRDVAELDVEYTVGERQPKVLARVVHLVGDEGKWRSLCYPA